MEVSFLVFFFLISLSIGARNSSIQRIELHRPSRKPVSLEKLANRLKLHALRTNGIHSHLETKNFLLKHIGESYITEITIGAPPQTFRVTVDTYTSYSYVPSVNCSDSACTSHRRYNSSESKTFKKDGRFVDVNGFQQGYLAIDDICIGDICAKNQGFVEVTKEFWLFRETPFDGWIGLGFLGNSTEASEVNPFFQTLFDQGRISAPIIGLYLNKSSGNDTIGGELSVGGIDPERFFAPINWAPMHYQTEWRVNIDKILINNTPVTCFNDCIANFNYQFHDIFGPTKHIDALFPGIGRDSTGVFTYYYLEDCTEEKIAALPLVSFVIGGEKYEIRGGDYVEPKEDDLCRLSFLGDEHETRERWTIGVGLIKNYYTAYDFQQKRMGLARAKN